MKRRNFIKSGIGITGISTLSNKVTAQNNGTLPNNGEKEEKYKAQIGNYLKLIDYEVSQGIKIEGEDNTKAEFTLQFEADRSLKVITTDAFGAFASKGVNRVSTDTNILSSGKNEIVQRVTSINNVAGIGIQTDDSAGIGISTGLPTESAENVTLPQGLLLGGTVMGLGTAISARRKLKGTENKPLNLNERIEKESGIWK